MINHLTTWPTAAAVFFLTFAGLNGPIRKLMLGRKGHVLKNLDDEYKKVLLSLFAVVKKPSRHVELEAMPAFRLRKAYFQSVMIRYGPSASKTANNTPKEPKIIHVAGSKGKGSTVEFVSAALREAGCKVGVFTSPHLHTACERIKIGDKLISREDFVKLGQWALGERGVHCQWAVFFDLLLAMALRYFCENEVEYIILETGIGGRFDSTNFVDAPVASIITSISMDHMAILGSTIEEIALQKAGIIKQGCPVVTSGAQNKRAMKVFKKVCAELNAPCTEAAVDTQLITQLGLDITSDVAVENACVAHAALSLLGLETRGMKHFFWPCRAEVFCMDQVHVVLDGSHNKDSVERFLRDMRRRYTGHHLCVVFGGGIEKCLVDMLDVACEEADTLIMAQSSHFKSQSESALVDAMNDKFRHKLVYQPPTYVFKGGTVATRLAQAVAYVSGKYTKMSGVHGDAMPLPPRPSAQQPAVVLICGSLFVASEAREAIFALSPSQFKDHDWVRHCDKFD